MTRRQLVSGSSPEWVTRSLTRETPEQSCDDRLVPCYSVGKVPRPDGARISRLHGPDALSGGQQGVAMMKTLFTIGSVICFLASIIALLIDVRFAIYGAVVAIYLLMVSND